MNKVHAVTYDPGDGPDTLVIVEAETHEEAIAKVRAWLLRIDVDAARDEDFTIETIGVRSEMIYLDKDGFGHQLGEDA